MTCDIFHGYTDASDRIAYVNRYFTVQECRDALDLHPGLQNSVRYAIQRRLTALQLAKPAYNPAAVTITSESVRAAVTRRSQMEVGS